MNRTMGDMRAAQQWKSDNAGESIDFCTLGMFIIGKLKAVLYLSIILNIDADRPTTRKID